MEILPVCCAAQALLALLEVRVEQSEFLFFLLSPLRPPSKKTLLFIGLMDQCSIAFPDVRNVLSTQLKP